MKYSLKCNISTLSTPRQLICRKRICISLYSRHECSFIDFTQVDTYWIGQREGGFTIVTSAGVVDDHLRVPAGVETDDVGGGTRDKL